LWEGNSIFFMPKLKEEDLAPQKPDPMYIGYKPIDIQKGLKYSNDVEEEKVCRFPSLGSKVYAHLVIRGEDNAELQKQIKKCIIKRCLALQQDLKEE